MENQIKTSIPEWRLECYFTCHLKSILLQPSETTILASTKDGHFVFATIEASFDEDPAFIDRLDSVLQSMGFSADESEEF